MNRRVGAAHLLVALVIGYVLGRRQPRRPSVATHDADPYDDDDDGDDDDDDGASYEPLNQSHGYVPALPRDVET